MPHGNGSTTQGRIVSVSSSVHEKLLMHCCVLRDDNRGKYIIENGLYNLVLVVCYLKLLQYIEVVSFIKCCNLFCRKTQ